MGKEMEIPWLGIRTNAVLQSIIDGQPLGLIGAGIVQMQELQRRMFEHPVLKDYVVWHLEVKDALRQNREDGFVGAIQVLCEKQLVGRLPQNALDQLSRRRELEYSDKTKRFIETYKFIVTSLRKPVVLLLSGYERLLALPREERRTFIGGLLFSFCDDNGPSEYNTSVVIASMCPLQWCEYEEDPNLSSVVYQRTFDREVEQPAQAHREEIMKYLPACDRKDFLNRTSL